MHHQCFPMKSTHLYQTNKQTKQKIKGINQKDNLQFFFTLTCGCTHTLVFCLNLKVTYTLPHRLLVYYMDEIYQSKKQKRNETKQNELGIGVFFTKIMSGNVKTCNSGPTLTYILKNIKTLFKTMNGWCEMWHEVNWKKTIRNFTF